jgi:hypothetical protein
MLTHKMDSEILQLHQKAENRLDSQSKFKLMVKNGTLESLQKMTERQSTEKRSDSSSYLLQILRGVIFFAYHGGIDAYSTDLTDNSKAISDQKTDRNILESLR